VPDYQNVVAEVLHDLLPKVQELRSRGFKDLIVDPGFGFSKALDHNYSLLAHLRSFKLLGAPILAGLSRKTMIWKELGITADEALNGSTVLHTVALLQGASILRVHDVKEAKETIHLVQKLQQNIKKRNRSYEQDIKDDYLFNLQETYTSYIKQHNIKTIFIDASNADFNGNDAHVQVVLDALEKDLPQGQHYFNLP
jgi:hypothetical protein